MDPHAGMTDEQREAAERKAKLATRDGQAEEFRAALKQALVAVNNEIAGLGEQPRIDAVIQALTMLQAEFVAMYPTRVGRRIALREIEHNLKQLVTLHANLAKPAKPLAAPDAKANRGHDEAQHGED